MAQLPPPTMVPLPGVDWGEFCIQHVDVRIQSSLDRFYNIFRKEAWRLPGQMSPDYVECITVENGDWKTVNSEKKVTYCPEGKSNGRRESFKDRLVRATESPKLVTFEVLSGNIMEHYKSFFAELLVTNLDGCNWARWTVAYQKKYERSPEPQDYLYLLEKISRDVHAKIPPN